MDSGFTRNSDEVLMEKRTFERADGTPHNITSATATESAEGNSVLQTTADSKQTYKSHGLQSQWWQVLSSVF